MSMSKLKIEITKFTIIGFVNTVFTFIVFYLLLKILNINYIIALSITWILGIFFSYLFNFLWIFKPEQYLQFKERFVKYLLCYFLSFALNIFILNYIVEHNNFEPLYVQTALIPFIAIFNFSTTKYWSLRP